MMPPWMAHAWACFGVREFKGRASNDAVLQMYKDAGHEAIVDDAVPWCAAFVGACLKRAGASGTGSLRARSYLQWGSQRDAPEYGAVAVLSRGKNPALGHVGFIVGETDRHVFLLGGNQSNAVSVAKYNKARLLAVRSVAPNAERSVSTPRLSSASVEVQSPSAFDICLPHVLAMEGGFADDPHDPGGPTNKGITLDTWARHKGIRLDATTRATLIDGLRAIPDAELRTIYLSRYWTPSRAEELPVGVDLAHFDASVNHGVRGAARLLQRTVGVVEDGIIGPITLGAVWSAAPTRLIKRHAANRERRYRALPHFWRFGRGWLRRTRATENTALERSQLAGIGERPGPLSTPNGLKSIHPPARRTMA